MKNKYDKCYEFRVASIEDVDDIMGFIRREWGKDHILGHDKKLFMWQYDRSEYKDSNTINFVLMTDKSNKIMGIIGFISYDKKNESISPTMTKVSVEAVIPMSGLELMKRQMNLIGEKAHFASGTNKRTILPLYEKVFHYKTGIMQQYFMLNNEISCYNIAKPSQVERSTSYLETDYSLYEVDSFDEASCLYDFDEINERLPIKSKEFMKKRYFCHPYYNYIKWIVMNEAREPEGFLVGREVVQNKTRILRLVDYRGDLYNLSKLGVALHNMLIEKRYEYIDLMASDLTEYRLDDAGFQLLDPDGELIIPNYFEPFVQANIKNYYQTKTDIVLFKADGDQDRPNNVKFCRGVDDEKHS